MKDTDTIIIALLTIISITLYIGFTEIFIRLRPRVVYVYGDEKKDDIPIWNRKTKHDDAAMRSRVPDAAPG